MPIESTAPSQATPVLLTLQELVPHLGVLLEHYGSHAKVRENFARHVNTLLCIRGGLRMVPSARAARAASSASSC